LWPPSSAERQQLCDKDTKATKENIKKKLFFVTFAPSWPGFSEVTGSRETVRLLMARTMKRATAFSLIETAMVVVIVGIVAAIAMPRYTNSLYSYRATMAANKIAADLTMARNDAFVSGSHRTVTFDQTNNQVTLTGVPDPNKKANANTVVNFAGAPYYAKLGSSTFTGNSFSFDGYGMAGGGGQVTVSAGSYTKTIVVDAGSGKVSVQ
jgi:Tfp pilus assembly protein FimT